MQTEALDYNIINQRLSENIHELRKRLRRTLLPHPDLTVSEFADKYRYLAETSMEPGKWRTSRVPHLKMIMDCANDPDIHQITIMGSSQIGKTEAINNILAYYIMIKPCPILYMLPTENDCRDFARDKFDAMIKATPMLRRLVRSYKEYSTDRESILRKNFPGGWMRIISANTSSSTRQRSAKLTIADDIDQIKYGQKEGDPIMRLAKRSTSFVDYLNIHISTPTIAGESRIDALYGLSNKMKYYVTCPECKNKYYFKFENLKWEKYEEGGKIIREYPETAYYECDYCKAHIDENMRINMLKAGQWVAEVPEITDHYGFWINELSSTLSSFQRVAKQYIDAKDEPEKLEAFYNTVLGLPFEKERIEELGDVEFGQKMEELTPDDPFVVNNNNILFGVQAIDVQGDRIEQLVLGVAPYDELYVLLYQKIWGDPLSTEIWDTAMKIYTTDWRRKDGRKIPMLRLYVDSGYLPSVVYRFVMGQEGRGIWAVKGNGRIGAPPLPRNYSIVDDGRVRLISLGTNSLKEILFKMLKNDIPGPGYIHLNKKYCDAEFIDQLKSERAVEKRVGMITYRVYEKKKHNLRNEAIDLLYMCYAAILHLNPDYEALIKREKLTAAKENPQNNSAEEIEGEQIEDRKPRRRTEPRRRRETPKR